MRSWTSIWMKRMPRPYAPSLFVPLDGCLVHVRLLTFTFRMCHKLKTIIEQCDIREMHFKTLLRHRDAEIQSLACKYEDQRRLAENEIARGRALSAQVSTFSHTEAELRSQLNIYVEKFKQV